MRDSPCYKCTKRYYKCHSTCPYGYKEWKVEYGEEQQRMHKTKQGIDDVKGLKIDSIERVRRRG